MTPPDSDLATPGEQPLSARSRAGYAADWALFADHCAVTDASALPASPETVLGFLQACPAAVGTQRRRVAAIDHTHTTAGYPTPGVDLAVRAILDRAVIPTEPPAADPDTLSAVQAALRGLPTTGWTGGFFGRRDGCLLVLSQLAGVPYRQLAALTAGDIDLTGGVVRIYTSAGDYEVGPNNDGPDAALVCGRCVIIRWLRALDLAASKPSIRICARMLTHATVPGPEEGPHRCRTIPPIHAATRSAPLLPPIDQWGYPPDVLQPLTPHSVSRRTRDLLAGDLGAHRNLPVDSDPALPVQEHTVPAKVEQPAPYGINDWQTALQRRRRDHYRMVEIIDDLDDIDQRADELNRRAAALLAAVTQPPS